MLPALGAITDSTKSSGILIVRRGPKSPRISSIELSMNLSIILQVLHVMFVELATSPHILHLRFPACRLYSSMIVNAVSPIGKRGEGPLYFYLVPAWFYFLAAACTSLAASTNDRQVIAASSSTVPTVFLWGWSTSIFSNALLRIRR